MDYPKNSDTVSMGLSILYFKGLSVKISIKLRIPVPEDIFFILANSEDPDETGSSPFAEVPAYRYPE